MKYQKNVMKFFAYFFQVGINMIVPIVISMFLGIGLDKLFHTSFIAIIMFFLGAGAGFRNIYIFAKSNTKGQSYLGSDAESKIDDMIREEKTQRKEDFFEKVDRLHKENMNE